MNPKVSDIVAQDLSQKLKRPLDSLHTFGCRYTKPDARLGAGFHVFCNRGVAALQSFRLMQAPKARSICTITKTQAFSKLVYLDCWVEAM